jgi:hypothetical protein
MGTNLLTLLLSFFAFVDMSMISLVRRRRLFSTMRIKLLCEAWRLAR